MPNADDIRWFKQQFHAEIAAALAGTALTPDLIVAIACQETGFLWQRLRRKGMPVDEILALCVGDTLDAPNRSAFPRNRDELIAHPRGQEMFTLARNALLAMAEHHPGYAFARTNPVKFAHGFGLFQYDIQFFKVDPDYFLLRKYEKFPATLGKCLDELRNATRKLKLDGKATLSEMEQVAIAIAYNTGGFNPARGLKQGHKSDDGKFYGEAILEFLRLSQTVPAPGVAVAPLPPPAVGTSILPPPTPVSATGPFFVVDVENTMLRLRSAPEISVPPDANVLSHLPDGHRVRAVSDTVQNGFREVETSLSGALLHGFASAKFLVPVTDTAPIPIVVPAPAAPTTGIVAAHMPPRPGLVISRRDQANARSLSEAGQPIRKGDTAEQRCAELAAIIAWLASDNPAHARYAPRDGSTFCNIYAHDFCHLAGVYLPRVWWTQAAIIRLARGEQVPPRIGDTILEIRANGLFHWLREFGPSFGWRQTGSLTKLQQEANMGALGVIVARRNNEGAPGHIAMVVPETATHAALRDGDGEVVAPLQSQAGAQNFRYGTGDRNWWRGAQFAESAFWLHA